MPDYVYKCDHCHHSAVVRHSIHDNPVVMCPTCDTAERRIIQTVAVNWNGLPPHLEHKRSPIATDLLDNAELNRDRYMEKHNKTLR